MSKYTTELRFICESESGLKESKGADSVDTIIAGARTKIFNFSYPIFDENYRSVLETKILKHFYTREIGEETYGLWKLRLNRILNEIMPYYNQLYKSELIEFNPLYTHNITRGHETEVDTRAKALSLSHKTSHNKNDQTNTFEHDNTDTTDMTNTNKYSDTPQGGLSNVENGRYLTNASINNEAGTIVTDTDDKTVVDSTTDIDNKSKAKNCNHSNSTEEYTETVLGYEGSNPNKLLKDFRDNILNIDMKIIAELETIFLQLW